LAQATGPRDFRSVTHFGHSSSLDHIRRWIVAMLEPAQCTRLSAECTVLRSGNTSISQNYQRNT